MKTDKKKNVIFLGKLPPPYIGPAVAAKIILNSSLKDEFNLIHLDMSDHRDINTLAKIDFTNFYLAFKQYFILAILIIKHKPALVYIPAGQTTVGYIRDAGFIVIAKFFRRKVLCHLRGGNFLNWYNSTSSLTRWIVRRVHSKVDGQIVLGNNLKGLFNWLLPDEKIFVIPNGGEYTFSHSKNGNTNGISVLFLGNFIGSKGILDVLKAAPIVCSAHPHVKFVFAGSWRDERTQNEFRQFMNDNPNLPVEIIGPVTGPEKFKLLSSVDIFAFPTFYHNEGHPWVIVEAMAAGLPIISTDHAAVPESVIDGYNGFLVKKRNPQHIAEKIITLIENKELRIKMGENSRKHYLEGFTEAKMIKRLSQAFCTVINN